MENLSGDLSGNIVSNELIFDEETQNELDQAFSTITLTQTVKMLAIEEILVDFDSTTISEQKIFQLCDSIKVVGLLQPIVVSENSKLVVGRHRYRAFQKLGLTHIPAIVLTFDFLRRQIAELDENLVRRNLSVLERALALRNRKELYETLYPHTKRGCYERSKITERSPNQRPAGFSRKISLECDMSPRTAQRLIQIANALNSEASRLIKNHRIANKQADLIWLARLSHQSQIAVAKLLIDGNLSSISQVLESLTETDLRLSNEMESGKRATTVVKKELSKEKIIAKDFRLARLMSYLIDKTEKFEVEEIKQMLKLANLPVQTLERWIIKMLKAINFESAISDSQSNKLVSAVNTKEKQKIKNSSGECSLPFSRRTLKT